MASPSASLANAKQLLVLVILATALVAAHGHVSSAGGAALKLRRRVRLHGGGGADHGQLLADLQVHDLRRHSIDVTIGGHPVSDKTGLYFTELEIGTPANAYRLQVDTGTGRMSINCFNCDTCPDKNGYGMKLKLYNPSASSSASYVSCGDTFCATINHGSPDGCTTSMPCQYNDITSTSTAGFFVRDLVHYNQVTGNVQSTPASTVITFGCGAKLSQDSPDQALDGVLGFGRADSSILSQLAATGQARKIFAHCLDTTNGGGIFVIGNVVQPNIMKRTALVPNTSNYNINLKSIDVDGTMLPLDTFTGNGKGTIIDSGTTFVYLPEAVYKTVAIKVFAAHNDALLYNFKDFMCFQYSGRVDDVFPQITFHFEGDLELKMYPHDYLLSNGSDWYCVGLRNGISLGDRKDMVILGDLVMSNKVVVYDLEAQVIGWTEYDCSSSIKVEDEVTKSTYDVKAHHIPSEAAVRCQISLLMLFVFGLLSW